MTEPQWRTHTPQYDGHAPDDWDGGYRQYFTLTEGWKPVYTNKDKWFRLNYRYFAKPTQDATHEPDLLAQCLRLPQADRDALIEALQKPQRDWADEVACALWGEWEENMENAVRDMARVIRAMCRPKEDCRSEEFEHVAYYDDCEFHWMSGIVSRDCELFARRKESLK